MPVQDYLLTLLPGDRKSETPEQLNAISSIHSLTYIDPVQASPNNYRLLDENDRVRVVEMTLKVGESDVLHSHPAATVFFISGGKVKIDIPGADSMEAEIPDGHVMFSDPWTHQVYNQGEKDVRAILIEHKD